MRLARMWPLCVVNSVGRAGEAGVMACCLCLYFFPGQRQEIRDRRQANDVQRRVSPFFDLPCLISESIATDSRFLQARPGTKFMH